MKSLTLTLMIMVCILHADAVLAQVAINTDSSSPNASSMLDVKSAIKGMLVPRVALAATNSTSPISPAPGATEEGLIVYNTATSGVSPNNVTPGYYYWDGSTWVRWSGGSGGLDWSLLGNSGTVDGTYFIGTTDNKPFNIRVNNQKAGRIDNTLANTFYGFQAGNTNTTGNYNTANGYQALYFNTTGTFNTALGYQTLRSNTTGDYNTASGSQALYSNTSGQSNTANGINALYSNTLGNFNTANGTQSLNSNTDGSYNTATGMNALYSNISGSFNTASGHNAMRNNTYSYQNVAMGNDALYTQSYSNGNAVWATDNVALGYKALYSNQPTSGTNGLENTAVGSQASYANTTGAYNTAGGWRALYSNTTGSSNTAFGYNADVGSGALTNATAIGNSAIVNASNKVRIGNSTVTVIEGEVAYTFPSDGRFKYNINESDVKGLEFIKLLRPVEYNFDTKKFEEFLTKNMPDSIRAKHFENTDFSASSSIRQSGFVAQDVEKAMKESGYNFNGVHKPADENDNYSIAYSLFTVPLVKAVQEQQKMIEELKMKNEKLETENAVILNEVKNLKADYDGRIKKLEETLVTN